MHFPRGQRLAAVLLPLAALLVLALPALDPAAQLYYRDTGRLYAPVKLYIAQRLARGELPLWDPWTEAGVSLLGQVTPGLLHPFTLLYAALPFELAFKLNHLLALPLAALGAHWLLRKLGASPFAAAAAAVAYGGCGFVVSMASSNLPFALGAATMPLSLAALLWLLQKPGPPRLLCASALLALCAFAGDPQAMLVTAVIGAALGVGLAAPAGLRPAARAGGLVALWGGCALLLSAPVSLPAFQNLARTDRAAVPPEDRDRFSLSPRRLPGLFVPLAFDEAGDRRQGSPPRTRFEEYFADEQAAPFSASIALGAPALLLALFAAGSRRGALLLGGAVVGLLASLGAALPVLAALQGAIPGLSLFRYAEKLAGASSLLFCAACAVGLDRSLRGDIRITRRLAAAAGVLALPALALGLYAQREPLALISAVAALGRSHQLILAHSFARALGSGLLLAGGLWLALLLVALLRLRRAGEVAPVLAASACAAAVLLTAPSALPVAPLEVLRAQSIFARDLVARAGPSEGRWRFFTNVGGKVPAPLFEDERLSREVGSAQVLQPQYDALAGIEGAQYYFSAIDLEYARALHDHPSQLFALLGVRFALFASEDYTPEEARKKGFRPTRWGYWLREFPASPRVFLEGQQRSDEGQVELTQVTPELQRLEVRAPREAALVVSTHFDPGWRATVDGFSKAVERYQHAVLALRVPSGKHRVELRFEPQGLRAGLWILAASLLALLLASALPLLRRARGR